jgi:tRNA nucleotidyltransferase (CCA-adding enzyme)
MNKFLNYINKILDDNKPSVSEIKDIRDGYREQVEGDLKNFFESNINFRYGGSLAKGTANRESCDIDLLCYFDYTSQISIENIYSSVAKILENNYICQQKNRAIVLSQKINDQK